MLIYFYLFLYLIYLFVYLPICAAWQMWLLKAPEGVTDLPVKELAFFRRARRPSGGMADMAGVSSSGFGEHHRLVKPVATYLIQLKKQFWRRKDFLRRGQWSLFFIGLLIDALRLSPSTWGHSCTAK